MGVNMRPVCGSQTGVNFPYDFEIIGGEKMGGRGSGRRSSYGVMVTKTNEVHSIDLAWLRRRKLLTAGRWSTLRWSRGGEETGSIQITGVPEGVLLSYRHRSQERDWEAIREVIPVVETATRFGGRRHWFTCLSCQRRCRIIYGGARFRCRKCMRLRYDTQYEPAFARAATKALKIRDRLGGRGGIHDPFPRKPKGMHQKTYQRLSLEEERLQSVWAVGIAAKFKFGDEQY